LVNYQDYTEMHGQQNIKKVLWLVYGGWSVRISSGKTTKLGVFLFYFSGSRHVSGQYTK